MQFPRRTWHVSLLPLCRRAASGYWCCAHFWPPAKLFSLVEITILGYLILTPPLILTSPPHLTLNLPILGGGGVIIWQGVRIGHNTGTWHPVCSSTPWGEAPGHGAEDPKRGKPLLNIEKWVEEGAFRFRRGHSLYSDKHIYQNYKKPDFNWNRAIALKTEHQNKTVQPFRMI